MKWFKHQSDMRNDPKIKRIIRRHGAAGYAVYCYIIEAISGRLSSKKPMPDLEETPEDISYDLNIELNIVTEIINTCLEQMLLSRDSETGIIYCYKIFKFLDDTTRKQTEVTKLLKEAEEKGYLSQGLISHFPTDKIDPDKNQIDGSESDKVGQTPTNSEDVGQTPSKSEDVGQTPNKSEDVGQSRIKSEKVRLEEEEEKEKEQTHTARIIRAEKNPAKIVCVCSIEQIKKLYHKKLPSLIRAEKKGWSEKSEGYLQTHLSENKECQNLSWWGGLFDEVLKNDFLMHRLPPGKSNIKFSLKWFVNPPRFKEIVHEDKYSLIKEKEKNPEPRQIRKIKMQKGKREELTKRAKKCYQERPGCTGENDGMISCEDENKPCGHCEVIEVHDIITGFELQDIAS